jgi:hypothetical protein
MDRQLTGWQGEDQPAFTGVDALEPEHVAQELAGALGVLGEEDGVRPGDQNS